MKNYLGLAAAALLAALPVSALAKDAKPPQSVQQLDAQLAAIFKDGKIPGATVALVENGRVTFAKGYGYADVAKKIPATGDTPFRAGSISKNFTAIGVMTLVEQHKLSLDMKIADFAPQVRFVNPWEKTNPIRLANLMEHTTGWPDIGTRVLAKDEKSWSILKGVEFSSPDFVSRWKPGAFMVYNNAGPAVAALALEKASGKTYDQFMRDAVLHPLGMKSADFDLTPDLAKCISKSYGADGSETPYQYIVLKPAGSLNISAREMAQLVRFYLFGGFVDGRRVLSPESVARIERSETNLASKDGFVQGYGLGNAIFPDSGPTFRGHNGSIDSFTSVMGYNRRSNSGYVLMANGGEGVDFATPVANLVQAYLTRDIKMTPPPTVKVSADDLAKYAGVYRVITPPNALLRPYVEIPSLVLGRVSVADGKLVVSGNDFFPVAPHVFRRHDREDASLAFVEEDGHVYKIGAFNAAEKAPSWLVAGSYIAGVLAILGAVIGLVMLIPWIVFAAQGRLAGGIVMRIAPLLSVVFLGIMVALPLMAYSDAGASAVHQLADIGWYSLTILISSVLFPLFALTGLVLALRNAEAHAIVRGYVIASSLGLLTFAAYFASIGWFAMRTWEM